MADTQEDGPGETTPFWSDEAVLLRFLAEPATCSVHQMKGYFSVV
jgi:hypothetical protein